MARICMVAYTNYLTDARVRREAEALAARGDSVDVISLNEDHAEGERVINGVRLIQLAILRYRGSSAAMYLVNYLLFFVAAANTLIRLHSRCRYQVVQIHTMPDFMVFVALVPKLLGAKVVLDVHDLMPELYQSKFGLPETHWLIRFITWTERRSVKFADKAIAVHQPHLDVLVRHGNLADKFIVLLNLPDPRIFGAQARVGSRNGPGFELIYHGTVSERHGLGVAVQAVSIARDEIPGLRLRIIGAGDAMQDLTALVGRLGVTDCVCLEGAVPLEALPGAIGDADVGIVPLLYDDFTRIMLPAKLLEYVALGKPVICSRTSTIEAYFDDSMVLYVTSGDAKELAEGIRFLYEHPEKREQLIASADRFNREYDWQRQKQLYYSLLDDLIGARQPAGTSHATPRRLR